MLRMTADSEVTCHSAARPGAGSGLNVGWEYQARRDRLGCLVRPYIKSTAAPLPSASAASLQECRRLGRIRHGGRRAGLAVAVEVGVEERAVRVRPTASSKPASAEGKGGGRKQ